MVLVFPSADFLYRPLQLFGGKRIDQNIEPAKFCRIKNSDSTGVCQMNAHDCLLGYASGSGLQTQFLIDGRNDFVTPEFDLPEHGFLVKVAQLGLQGNMLGLENADFFQ